MRRSPIRNIAGWVTTRVLAARVAGPRDRRQTWAGDHGTQLRADAVDVRENADLGPLLGAVNFYGIGLAHGLDRAPEEVVRFTERFGFVRETNYGRLFDVVAEPDPVNLAYTPRGLALHTDNPYRDPVPTLQVLHCLNASAAGGATRFGDGFNAAERLRADSPEAFAVLAAHEVGFRSHDRTCDLRASGKIIDVDVDAAGTVVGVRVNHRSMEPPILHSDVLPHFYAAYRRFCELLAEPGASIELTLSEGDVVVFDNRRVLHGRSAYPATERRHLQGCYADIDAVRSAVLMAVTQ